jgi:hypothetical protein
MGGRIVQYMNEGDVRLEVYHSLQGYGYWPLHGRDAILCPRCGAKILPQVAGRPDLLVLDPIGKTLVCEVKIVDLDKALSFAFTQVEDDQRRWLNAWTQHSGYGYLAIGTVNERPRRLWVIPWTFWSALEADLIDGGFGSIPVDLSLYKRVSRAVPTTDLVACNSEYGMKWVVGTKVKDEKFTGSHWEFPEWHEIVKERTCLWTTK